MKRTITLASVLVLSITVSACAFHAGSHKYVKTTTLGQELLDLKQALETGAISEPEYRAVKESLMNEDHWPDVRNNH